MKTTLHILAIGATGSVGRYVVEAALARGHRVRALVRHAGRADLPAAAERVTGDLTEPGSLWAALEGVEAVVFTHGTHGAPSAAEAVDYAGVRNVLAALGGSKPHIALMTAIGVTDRKGAHDWKRRAERLVRASRCPYTIVRPGWFDYNDAGQHRLVFLQGDGRQTGTPSDGAIARQQIATVLVDSLTSVAARRKTFELVAERGPAQADMEPLFAAVAPDRPGALDGVGDSANMPLEDEPRSVLTDLEAIDARCRI